MSRTWIFSNQNGRARPYVVCTSMAMSRTISSSGPLMKTVGIFLRLYAVWKDDWIMSFSGRTFPTASSMPVKWSLKDAYWWTGVASLGPIIEWRMVICCKSIPNTGRRYMQLRRIHLCVFGLSSQAIWRWAIPRFRQSWSIPQSSIKYLHRIHVSWLKIWVHFIQREDK